MYVQSLELENFRNYKNLNICFDIGTNILYGNNAQGKTNIMEAIYVCGTSKSHRSSKDKEMIRFGADDAHIKMVVMKREVPIRIDMHLRKNKTKGIAINGIPIKKVSELFGVINVVFFSPEDLSIIKNGPSDRRRFIDLELCQLDKVYVHNLMNYNKIINQRNQLLKDLNYYYDSDLYNTLDIWDMQLAEYSKKIISRRSEFIEELNEIIYGIHRNITNGKEELYIKYEPNIYENNIYEELKKSRDKDIKYKTTSIGPHRDDISFYNKDIDIRKYGSQGQQRTAALSLKLSEIELVKNVIKDMPVLLLDDVLSELDSSRQSHLLNSLHNVQTVITCTGLDEFVQNRFNIDNVYKIVEGTVERSNNE
jgi:DNA replication and repair protein RecF